MKFKSSEELRSELKVIIDDPFFDEWFDIVSPFLIHDEVQKRKLFKNHTASVWDNSIEDSFKAFKLAYKLNADRRVCAIAGLMHDFYPFAWQYSKELDEYDKSYLARLSKKEFFFKKHGFTHAKEARKNFEKYFSEYADKKILNAIQRHMFPLNIIPPKYKESWIITITDKQSSFRDTFHIIAALLKKGN